MKLPTKCILDKYDTYRKILKFSIKNDDNPQYKDFSLIDSYIMILIEIEKNLDGIFEEKVRIRHSTNYEEPLKESKFESLLYSIIYEDSENFDEEDEIHQLKMNINEEKKKELIRRFELVMELSDCALDRIHDDEEVGPLMRFKIIDNELSKILTYFSPILNKILYNNNK